MVESALFIALIITAIVQVIKMYVPKVNGGVTILVAFAVAILISLVDQFIGVTDVTIAEAIVSALGAIGLSTLAGKAGGGAAGDE